jgi:TonB family protein
MSDSWKDCEGQVIDGKFPLVQHLGGSDHSVVFLTQRGKSSPEKAAIKFVQADPTNAELQLSRWEQAAQISHPNLIKLLETGRCHLAGMDLLYVVMEYAPENLAQFLPERALSPAETRDMLEPFLETLTNLHRRGFVHGRIKPGNIHAIDDQLKLSSDSLSRVGESQGLVEKPDVYTAPESAGGAASPAGDVWSLGVTLVETLTQRVPDQQEQQDLQVSDSVPQPFLDIARHSLRRDPQSRWTVAEISARLHPPAIPPTPKVSAAAIPDPIKPAPPKPSAVATSPVVTAAKTSKSAKSVDSIDPLSVPLSNVPPMLPSKQHALEHQMVTGGSAPYRSYYVVIAILVALTLGAMLAIPRLRDRGSEPDKSSALRSPSVQPETSPAVQSQPQSTEKQATAMPDPTKQGPLPRSAGQPAQSSSPNSIKTASEKQFVRNEQLSANAQPPTPPAPALVQPHPVFATPSKPASAPAGVVTQGEVINQVLPEVSARSRSTIHGTVRVVVKVHVDASGTVTEAEPASTPSRFFGDAAVQAAKRWDFAPAKVADQRVPSVWLLRFDFTQADTKVLPSQTTP